MAKRKPPVTKNQQVEGVIEDLSYQGMGVLKVEGYPLFVSNALPGERCLLRVLRANKNYGFAHVIKRYNDADIRVPLTDEDGLRVGTMPLQHMTYPAQLEFKTQQVENAFHKHDNLCDFVVLPTLGMETPWKYRNKAQIPVGEKEGHLMTGFYRRGTHDILPIEDFKIQLPGIDEAIIAVRDILEQYKLSAYDEVKHRGLIRHIIIRKGYYTDQVMVILVINGKTLPHEREITEEILKDVPHTVSVVVNHNTERTNVIMGRRQTVLYGEDFYQDQMFDMIFDISSQSFFQVNTQQAEVLYKKALELAALEGDEVAIDAYCGIGTITLKVARHVKEVYGVEIVEDAIKMAEKNARINKITNAHFVAGKAEEVIYDWKREGLKPDVIFVDPPRKGLDPDFLKAAVALAPEKLVYISCNPATLARDVSLFVQAGYIGTEVQPVDLFPQSNHVEAVVLLSRTLE